MKITFKGEEVEILGKQDLTGNILKIKVKSSGEEKSIHSSFLKFEKEVISKDKANLEMMKIVSKISDLCVKTKLVGMKSNQLNLFNLTSFVNELLDLNEEFISVIDSQHRLLEKTIKALEDK